jgi:uncharacterized protein YbdZ (MbtH family)
MTDNRTFLRVLFDAAVAGHSGSKTDLPGMSLWSAQARLPQAWPPSLSNNGRNRCAAWSSSRTGIKPIAIRSRSSKHPTRFPILDLVSNLSADDTVVCLLSGGGSSLLCAPAPGITLNEKKAKTIELLASGLPIHEINRARRELSAVKGGKLAEACAPAHVITLIISDVPGNDPAVVASGPTLIDAATARENDVRILATSDDAIQAAALRAHCRR